MTNSSANRAGGRGAAGEGPRGLQEPGGGDSAAHDATQPQARDGKAFPFLTVMLPMLAIMALALAGAIAAL